MRPLARETFLATREIRPFRKKKSRGKETIPIFTSKFEIRYQTYPSFLLSISFSSISESHFALKERKRGKKREREGGKGSRLNEIARGSKVGLVA